MIAISMFAETPHFPIRITGILQFFTSLPSSGAKCTMSVSELCQVSAEVICSQYHIDFDEIEESFCCDFVEVPDDIENENDFKNWIMEMKVD